jgi:hypothetical protein
MSSASPPQLRKDATAVGRAKVTGSRRVAVQTPPEQRRSQTQTRPRLAGARGGGGWGGGEPAQPPMPKYSALKPKPFAATIDRNELRVQHRVCSCAALSRSLIAHRLELLPPSPRPFARLFRPPSIPSTARNPQPHNNT